jgi:RNA polymerase sigma factor (sigma-70 family)
MPLETPGPDRWVADAQSGDSLALEALYNEFQPLIARLLRRYHHLQLHDILADLPSETFVAFAGLVQRYDAARGVPFPGYIERMLPATLHTVVRRRCRQLARERAVGHGTDEWADLSSQAVLATHGAPGEESTTDAVARRLDLRVLLERAIAALPPREAYVFTQRAVRDAEYTAIAAALGTSVGAVRVLYCNACKRLRQTLRKEGGLEP